MKRGFGMKKNGFFGLAAKTFIMILSLMMIVSVCVAAMADGTTNIHVLKYDEHHTSLYLSGATFKMVGSDGISYTATTNENGEAVFTVPCGLYYTLTEIAAPEGYDLSTEEAIIDMSHDDDENHTEIISTGWCNSNKPTLTKTGGEVELLELVVTQEEIDKSAGKVYVEIQGRASRFPNVPIAQLEQRLVMTMVTNVTIDSTGYNYSLSPIPGVEQVEIQTDADGRKYVDKPCVIVGILVCKNQDQKPGGRFPMPYSLDYELCMTKTIHEVDDEYIEFGDIRHVDAPKTGDKTDVALLIALLTLSAVGMTFIAARRKHEA